MGRTYVKGSQVLDGDITDLDLANGSVTGPKLGVGALIGTDIQPFSEALLGVERVLNISTNKNLVLTDQGLILITASTSNLVMNLPAASSVPGTRYIFKRLDSTSRIVTISTGGTDLIDTVSTRQLIQWEWIEVESDGNTWYIRNEGPPKIELPSTGTGLPGYAVPGVGVVSIDRAIFHFSKKGGSKNRYLKSGSDINDSDFGVPILRNAYIASMIGSTSKNTDAVTYFHVRSPGSNTNLYTLTLPNNGNYVKAENIWIPLAADQQIQVYVQSTKSAEDAYAQIEIAWR